MSVRQAKAFAVGVFAILSVALVQATDKDYVVGISSHLHSFCYQFFGRAVVFQVLTGYYAVVFTACIAHVATGVNDFCLIAYTLLDAVQRREFALYLQRRTTATYGHHLNSIFAYYGNLLCVVQVYRKHIVLVLQQYDAFFTNAAGCFVMFGREQCTERTVRVHRGTESQAKDTTYFVVQFLGAYLAFLNALQVRHSQVIIIVSIAGTVGKTVGPAAEFHIHSVGDGLVCIVHTSPVGNNYAVEAPFAFQDIVQQILVVAGMLTFIKVVSTHDGPCITFLHGSFESRQIDFVQSTVVYNDIGVVTVHFMIVQREVLYASGNTILLYTLYVGNNHTAGQIRIFTHILEVTSVQRCAVDVYTGTQKNGLVTIAGFFADALSV